MLFTTSRILILVLIFILMSFGTLHAETLLSSGNTSGGTFTKEGNPYILTEPITFSNKLIIKEGVILMTASSTRTPWQNYTNGPYIEARGGVEMVGTEKEPIRIIGLAPTLIRRPVSSRIEHVWFENSPLFLQTSSVGPFGTGGFLGTTTIAHSKLTGSEVAAGLEVNSGAVVVLDSVISGNPIGILSDTTAYKTHVVVKNSSLQNNRHLDIHNRISLPMHAQNNWWGSSEGPGDNVEGPVVIEPWKKEDPFVKKVTCCSNVLFLPGFQASRLTTPTLTGTNRLWEPNRNDDVRKLYLNPDGTSIDPATSVGGVIETAYGIRNIYTSFFAMMKAMVAEKKINEWKPFAYDWRMNVSDLARGEVVKEVERLASTSQTGKVTLVAHSNGGLLAKRLGYELEKLGKSALIDKVILVATPLLGTPMAAAAILNGSEQEFLGGLLMKPSVARMLGLNMLGAYGLLPSREFFAKVSEPVITLAGKALTTYESFAEFLTGGRVQPAENDLISPAVLRPELLSLSEKLHGTIDTWKFPTTTEELRLVGWGVPTVSSIAYSSSTPFIRKNIRGDSTVTSQSAADPFAKTLYFNQGHYNFDQRKSIHHDNIFESEVVRDIIAKSIATTSIFARSDSPYITEVEPSEASPWMKWLTVSVHSPVDLHIYDSRGGHMGPVPLPNALDSDLMWFENTIGGQVEIIGDEKYYTIPAGENYTIDLKGTGVGTFTFQVQKLQGTDMIEVVNTLYTDLPVTPLLEAQMTLSEADLAPSLRLDVDGNGTYDLNAGTSTVMNPLLHLNAMKILVTSLSLDSKEEKQLLNRIERIRASLEKNKEHVSAKIKTAIQKIEEGHWNLKTMTQEQKILLESLLSELIQSIESVN